MHCDEENVYEKLFPNAKIKVVFCLMFHDVIHYPYLNSFDRDPSLIILNDTLEDRICIQDTHYDDFNFQDGVTTH